MKTYILVVTVFMLIVFNACSNDDSESEHSFDLKDNTEICISDPRITDPNYEGTICCLYRVDDLALNSPIDYLYITNLTNATATWSVFSGNIEIISGVNDTRVTIKLKDGFTEGELIALGTTEGGLNCAVSVIITKVE